MSDLSPLARTLAVYIAEYRTQRVPLDDLRDHAYARHTTLTGDLTARTRLRAALDSLVAAGNVTLPSARNRQAWETTPNPPLPRWVNRRREDLEPVQTVPPPRVWPARLEAAAALGTRPDEIELLTVIADWMRDRPAPQPVPLEERSLELFGYEKRLGDLTGTRLFTSGALTLDLLGCHPTPVPLPSVHIPGGGPTRLLVCENSAAYYSVTTAARALPSEQRPDLHVAFGGGGGFTASHDQIVFLDPSPTRLYYCGDLDMAGLRIAVNATTRYAATAGPDGQRLEPAVAHYEWMLTHGHRQPDASNIGTLGDHRALVEWLPAHLHQQVATLLGSRMRVSQETVGLDVLTSQSHLVTGL